MLKAKGMLLAAIFALSVLLVPLCHAQDDDYEQEPTPTSQARIVRLSYAEGTVEMVTDRGRENATMNVPLTEGDEITTGDNGWAEVQLEDGSTIRLAPSSQIIFSELGRASSGATLTTVDLDGGEAEFKVSHRHDDQFAVTVGPRTILLNHSGRFRVTSDNQDPLEIAVFKGEVKLRDPDSGDQLAVKKDETFTLDPMDSAHYALDKGTEADDLDDWSERRDEALSTYASADVSNNVQSPYQYGLDDLNYYGTYYNVAGYGWLWQPYGAGLGWNPFINGYWTLTPYGYVWVSAYPWGWMPYRYGQWIFVNGSGWMWQPGGWHGWWRRPRLVNTPPGFHPPAPPAHGNVVTGNPRIPSIPRVSRPGDRPRRVFNNDNVEGSLPARDHDRDRDHHPNVGSAGVIHADTQPAIVPRENAATTGPETIAPEARVPRNERPAASPGAGEFHGRPERVPSVHVTRPPEPPVHAARPPQPPAPVMQAHPAPTVVPSRPASPPPAPRVAPQVSQPRAAPRPYSPPPVHVGASTPREAAPAAPGRKR